MIPFPQLHRFTKQHQVVLLRADLNVPMHEGKIVDSSRIESLIPTIEYLKKLNSKIVLISHFGRPKERSNQYSLAPLQQEIANVLQTPAGFIDDCIGLQVTQGIATMPYQSILLLENLRFYEGEESNDLTFAKQLAEHAQIYINDAFSCCHRAHASISGITNFLPSYAGLSLEAEINHLQKILHAPQRPLMAIVGGAKISSKLILLENLATHVDTLFIGGAMANTFQVAKGYNIGNSLVELEMIPTAKNILEKFGDKIILPIDVVVKNSAQMICIESLPNDADIHDIGIKTRALVCEKIAQVHTVVWNGPLGVFETKPFEQGTAHVAHFVAEQTKFGKLVSVAGGGDTASALKKVNVFDDFSFVSTAGGAFLEWLEGKHLPGIEALKKTIL